jgi:hypothetical protein
VEQRHQHPAPARRGDLDPAGQQHARADVYAADPNGDVYDDEVDPVTGASLFLLFRLLANLKEAQRPTER